MRNFKENNKNFIGVREDLFRSFYAYEIDLIGIPIDNNFEKIKSIIDLCDGVILSGGDKFMKNDFLLVEYLYKINKPTLGICLGMQGMARYFSKKEEINILNHQKSDLDGHYINILKDSLLYKILGNSRIFVNSRHKSAIVDTNLIIGAKSDDLIIEEVEDKSKKFFLGVQWHPESIKDEYSKKLFDYFIKII